VIGSICKVKKLSGKVSVFQHSFRRSEFAIRESSGTNYPLWWRRLPALHAGRRKIG
jgi:hypothetical protein